MKLHFFAIAVLSITVSVSVALAQETRKWTDKNGNTVTAKLAVINVNDAGRPVSVILDLATGKQAEVSLDKLNESDRQFVIKLHESREKEKKQQRSRWIIEKSRVPASPLSIVYVLPSWAPPTEKTLPQFLKWAQAVSKGLDPMGTRMQFLIVTDEDVKDETSKIVRAANEQSKCNIQLIVAPMDFKPSFDDWWTDAIAIASAGKSNQTVPAIIVYRHGHAAPVHAETVGDYEDKANAFSTAINPPFELVEKASVTFLEKTLPQNDTSQNRSKNKDNAAK